MNSYDKARKFVLRMYHWGFATKRVVLAPAVSPLTDPATPAFEFDYSRKLPDDFLRVVELFEYDGAFRTENGHILCNSDTISLRYISDVTDLTDADPLFIEAVEWYLGYLLSRYLTESEAVRNEALAGFKGVLPYAKFIQSTENSQLGMDADDLINSRL